jgi:GntR family transcriptional regulator
MTSTAIDRAAPLPLYFQLKQQLVGEIRDHGLAPGDRLPSESAIERRYGVSRTTIRQALNELVIEGVVERVQGKGTFVAAPKITHVPLLTSFTENMRSQGYVPSRRVLVSVVAEAPPDVAAKLSLERSGERCRFLRRLLLADDEVVGVAETWLPVSVLGPHDEFFDPVQLEQGSLYDLLQGPDIGLVLHRGVETVKPRVADAQYASLLQCGEHASVLVVDRLTYTPEERPVEATRMVFAGSRYEYKAEMFRP